MLLVRVVIFSSSIMISGCTGNTALNYVPPNADTNLVDIVSTSQAQRVARTAASDYGSWATNVASSVQVFEIPIIGSALAAAVEVAYGHPHTGPLTSLALAAGGPGLVDNYYNPRQRVTVYYAAQQAMSCISRTTIPVSSESEINASGMEVGDKPWIFGQGSFTLTDLLAAAPDEQTKSTLRTLINLENTKPSIIIDAIEQVNQEAVTRGLSASVAPNTASIASTLKQSIQNAESLKQSTSTSQATAAAAPVPAAPPGGPPTPTPQDVASALTTARVQALTTLQSDLNACVAKAGV